ncbi:hypothetical protein CWO89_18290 [Bradyrhizobium sp. Leo170]|nr:hypothetical protein CWO89_18290 [Bradyrhizobium sp. Leo170]
MLLFPPNWTTTNEAAEPRRLERVAREQAALCLLDESRNAMLEIAGNYTRAAAVSQTSSPLLAGLFAWWWRLVCG